MYITRKKFEENINSCKAKIDELIFETKSEDRREEIYAYIASYEDILDGMQKIINDYIYNKKLVVESCPKMSINLSPQASGKSRLNHYASNRMNANCVIINSDDLKKYYPRAKELSESEFSVFYTYITDIGSNLYASTLLEFSLCEGYNIVFEGTGKNDRILTTIEPYRKKYQIKIRTIVVAAVTSLSAIMLRYVNQKKTSECGRFVRCSDFLNAYKNIVNVIEKAESKGHVVEVFARGKREDSLPLKLYASKQRGGFADAVCAIKYAREFNLRLSKEENVEKLRTVKEYCAQNSWKENTVCYAEIVNCFFNILTMSAEFDDELDF